MAENPQPDAEAAGRGDRRGKDRRGGDRRDNERRTPPPAWRQPWALVAYGILGTLVVVMFFNRSRPPEPAPVGDEIVTTAPLAPAAVEVAGPASDGGIEDATRAIDYQRLVGEGEAAKGRLVRAELFCSSISQVSLRSVDRVEGAIAELAGSANRVPVAECRWGARQGDEPRGDMHLLIPPDLADAFANAPIVDDAFVSRRHLRGVVEWIGRSEALSLRTTGVLRQLP
ncbi:hypothetical protein BH23GEM3_BH23GEM3_10980 [soil metagenome]|nr:hypothetical protein [Gemmatimonadota bacterium]